MVIVPSVTRVGWKGGMGMVLMIILLLSYISIHYVIGRVTTNYCPCNKEHLSEPRHLLPATQYRTRALRMRRSPAHHCNYQPFIPCYFLTLPVIYDYSCYSPTIVVIPFFFLLVSCYILLFSIDICNIFFLLL